MSWEATTHALGLQLFSATRKLILMGFANHAHKDGTAAFPGLPTVMEYAECSKSTAQRHVTWLVEHGHMREGDQRLVAHYPANKRPIVYDLAMNEQQRVEWEIHHATGGNVLRESAKVSGAKGGQKSAQVRRGVKTTPVAIESNGPDSGGVDMTRQPGGVIPAGSGAPGVSSDAVGGVTHDTQTTQEPSGTTNLPSNPSSEPLRDPDPESGEIEDRNKDRADVTEVCDLLARRLVEIGCKPPTVGARWRDAARLLMDTDGRSKQQVRNMIDWATSDPFWRANIHSMPTLREKYDQMRLRALEETAKPGGRPPAYDGEKVWGPRPGAQPDAPTEDVEPTMTDEELAAYYGLGADDDDQSSTHTG